MYCASCVMTCFAMIEIRCWLTVVGFWCVLIVGVGRRSCLLLLLALIVACVGCCALFVLFLSWILF